MIGFLASSRSWNVPLLLQIMFQWGCLLSTPGMTTEAFSPTPFQHQIVEFPPYRNLVPRRGLILQEGKQDQEEKELLEAQKLQAEINKMVEEPPMFSSFNPDNIDGSALPIPTFTAIVVAAASIGFTAYLYYVGIYGFPSTTN